MQLTSFGQLFRTPTPATNGVATLQQTFSNIYGNGIWGDGSGPGSRPENVRPYTEMLQAFLRQHDIRTIIDCGCGDWQFSRHLDFGTARYIGVDIVPSVIEANRKAFARDGVEFRCGDFTSIDLPAADLVICKDVLQHLPDANVARFLAQLPKFRFALLTDDVGSNVDRAGTLAAAAYHYARVDICSAPFAVSGRVVCHLPGDKRTVLVERDASGDAGAVSTVRPAWEPPRSAETEAKLPTVLLAILAKQKQATLPLYLRCIEALDYPKSKIHLYVRSNNNTDRTEAILREWLARVGEQYASVEVDYRNVAEQVQQFAVHEWNQMRFKVLAFIRQQSLQKTLERRCDFYFTADVDNFLRPKTLRALVNVNLPIVGPLLRHEDSTNSYSNFHHEIDTNGYFADSPEYHLLLEQKLRGLAEVKVIHCTYLVRAELIPELTYNDGSERYEYVIFSASARIAGAPQYLDAREVYGYLTLTEQSERAEQLIGREVNAALERAAAAQLRAS